MNKKGFALLETLIVVVIISTSLVTLYHAYNYSVVNENIRLHYDDVNYIYKTHYLKNNLELTEDDFLVINDESITNTLENNDIKETFNVKQMLIIKTDFDLISSCTMDLIKGTSSSSDELCENSFGNYDENLIKYIKTLGSDTSLTENDYLLVVLYEEENLLNYASLKLEVPNE